MKLPQKLPPASNWITLFSQTGSEIAALTSCLERVPSYILTNASQNGTYIDPRIALGRPRPAWGTHDELMDFLRNIEPSLVTLHGYLRIIPPDVCERHEIYNGHPGLITEYPELKGKDPQEKVWITPSAYATIGSVVHECTPGVDEGPIVATASMPNDDVSSKLVLYTRLRKTSLEAWLKFFAKRFE